jgi:hypothetical protein
MMEFVNGKDDIPYMKWKIKFMCETTNQSISVGFSIMNHPAIGVFPFMETPISHPIYIYVTNGSKNSSKDRGGNHGFPVDVQPHNPVIRCDEGGC